MARIGEHDGSTFDRISSETVRAATGSAWEEWLQALDDAGARDWSHKQIVAYLKREHSDAMTAWWRQSITVAYEQARGTRAVGETAGGVPGRRSTNRSRRCQAGVGPDHLATRPLAGRRCGRRLRRRRALRGAAGGRGPRRSGRDPGGEAV